MTLRLLAVAVVACGNSSQSPAPAPSPAAPAWPSSTEVVASPHVRLETFHSDALGVDKDVRVYLPASYAPESGKRWPVFYYLHGLTGDEANWTKLGKLDAVADEIGLDAIVVMPDGDNSFYVDSDKHLDYETCLRDGAGLLDPRQSKPKTCTRTAKYETYVTQDLIGWVDRTYKTIASREGRGIAGVSMGGYGALMLAMRHPDLFSAAASHSGIDSLLYAGPFPYEPGKAALMTDPDQILENLADFGRWLIRLYGEDLENWRAHDPTTLVDKLRPGQLQLYLDCGTEDDFALYNGMRYLHDLLLAKHIEHAYYLGPGHHDFAFWRQRLPKSLAFLRATVAKPH